MSGGNFLSRRGLMTGGVAAAALVQLPSCAPLFGLMLRGGALRAFSAGARLGGTTSLVSLGRGVGIAGRSVKSARVSVPQGSEPVRIVSKDGRVLARSLQEGQATVLMRGNQRIFRSNANARNQNDVGRLDHIDLHGNTVGRSMFEHNGRVDHYGPSRRGRDTRIGFDVIMRGARIIKHFDQNENEIGETELQQNGPYTDVISDEHTDEFLTELEQRDEQCPELVAQRDVYYNTYRSCSDGSSAACSRQPMELRRLRLLEQACQKS